MLQLRPYQSDVINRVYESMKSGKKRPIICLPTGAGKTACFAWMTDRTQQNNKTVWFLVHRRELYDQTIETFNRFGIERKRITVSMILRASRGGLPKPDLIVVDEAHHTASKTWRGVIEQNPDAHVIGLTATPARLDGKPLGEIYDDLIVGPSTADLINQGYLSDYDYYSVAVADLAGLKRRGIDYDTQEAARRLSGTKIYGDVINTYKEHADGLQAILFAPSVEYSENMAAEFTAAGIPAVHFDGRTADKKRRDVVRAFRSGDIRVLCNVELVGEGFDVPACDCVIQLRPTMSLTLFLQQCGRALRPRENKKAVIIDHVGNYTRHGLPDDPRDWSLTETVQTRTQNSDGSYSVRMCPYCLTVYRSTATHCPACGTLYRPDSREIKQIEAVKLQKIKRKEQERSEQRLAEIQIEADCRCYGDLYKLAKKCGHENPKRYAVQRSYALGFRLPWERR